MDRNRQAQRRYSQYLNAKNYDGDIVIFENIVEREKDSLWIEFSFKPTLMSRTYKVLLVYVYGYDPSVYILDPDIIILAEKRSVPHLYSQELQRLCLTYPSYNEWNDDKPIANTYIPWIALWIFYYEEWLLSDSWNGGGRHPGDETEDEVKISSKKSKSKKKSKKLSPIEIANKIYHKRKQKYQQEKKVVSGIEGSV